MSEIQTARVLVCWTALLALWFIAKWSYRAGEKRGFIDAVSRYFDEDDLHLIIPYKSITPDRAEEYARFILAKKEVHERSGANGTTNIHNQEAPRGVRWTKRLGLN